MNEHRATVTIDTREPWPHGWCATGAWQGIEVERGTLETGDVCLARDPDGAVVERKTVADLLGCIGTGRERFERELKRGRYCGRFIVVIEGDMGEVLREARGLHRNAIVGTLAAWQRRYCPFFFAGNVETAADFALRFLGQPLRKGI